jgi:hypothetical protein
MAHVETDIYPFQIALWNIRALLLEVVQSHVLIFENLVMQSYPQMRSSLMDQLHKHEFISILAGARLDVVQTCLHSYAGLVVGTWLLLCPSTLSFRLSSTHFFFSILYSSRYTTSYNYVSFMMPMWSYHR